MLILKKGIVDRFEGDFAVIEVDGKTHDVKKSEVNPEVKVNDVVIFRDGKWVTDPNETKSRKTQIKKLMESVWED